MSMRGSRLIESPAGWETMRRDFRWPDLQRFNIAEVTCEHWAKVDPGRVALRYLDPEGRGQDFTYRDLSKTSNRLTNTLAAFGVQRGDRVALLLPQAPETALTHLACYKLGAIVVPLFTLFGEEGLQFRLSDSGAKVIITDAQNLPKISAIRDQLPDMETVFCVDGAGDGGIGLHEEMAKASDQARSVETAPDDPAFLSYTSGTTGPPKGALHGHRVLLGHLPGVELHHNFLPHEGDCLWTPADWAWMGGLTNVMLPALYYGVRLVVHRMAKFDPERAFDLIEREGVRNTFLPPTALKLMRQASPRRLRLRSVASGGEALGASMLDWGQESFGVPINEFYGQTECNLVLSNSHSVLEIRPGSMGRAVPGHDLAVIDAGGQAVSPGNVGEIAIRRPDPAMFLRYWNAPEKTQDKFIGDWMRTGDEGYMDEDGYFFFSSRSDDVITSSGYRIGPSEIEACLTGHPDVTMAAAIGVPDEVRTEVVRAFVVLREGATQEGLENELIERVRARLSPHVAPKDIVFIDALPMTATGKIMRRALKQSDKT